VQVKCRRDGVDAQRRHGADSVLLRTGGGPCAAPLHATQQSGKRGRADRLRKVSDQRFFVVSRRQRN